MNREESSGAFVGVAILVEVCNPIIFEAPFTPALGIAGHLERESRGVSFRFFKRQSTESNGSRFYRHLVHAR